MSNLNIEISDHKQYQQEQYAKTLDKLEKKEGRIKQIIYFSFFTSIVIATFVTLWVILIYYLFMNIEWFGG